MYEYHDIYSMFMFVNSVNILFSSKIVLTPIDDSTDTLECLLILLCILWVLMNLINFGPNLKG